MRWPSPVVAFESPQRLPATLRSLAEVDSERPIAVCRELTKLHEEVVRGKTVDVAVQFESAPRGEITLVLGRGSGDAEAADVTAAAAAVRELVAAGAAHGRAVEIVARLTGTPRNALYRGTL